MGTTNAVLLGLGVFSIVLALVYLAAAYGLMKLESWSPLLATVALGISIPLDFVIIWLSPSPLNLAMNGGGIVVAIAAIWYLQRAEVTGLYRSMAEQRVTP